MLYLLYASVYKILAKTGGYNMKKLFSGVLILMTIMMVMGCKKEPDPEKDFVTLTMDANGGADADGETQWEMHAPKGSKANLLENEFVRDGYIFLGWANDKDATTIDYEDKANYTFTGNKTIYAVWEKIALAGAPTNVAAATLYSRDGISWKAVNGATKYIIYKNLKNDTATAEEYKTIKKSDFNYLQETKSLKIENDVITSEVFFNSGKGLYYFWVKAANDEETSDFSSVVIINNGNLQALQSLTVAKSTTIKNKVRFTFDYDYLKSYKLYENTTNDFASATLRTKSILKTYDLTLNESGTYYYWITVVDALSTNGRAESAPSPVASIEFTRDELKTPTTTNASLGADNTTVTVTWTKVDDKKPGQFLLYYYYNNGNHSPTGTTIDDYTLIVLDGGVTSKAIQNLGTGSFYWYILEADDDPSIFTNTKKSTPDDIAHTQNFLGV